MIINAKTYQLFENGIALTEFRTTTFQKVCYHHKQNNNLTVQFESQQYKIEMKII